MVSKLNAKEILKNSVIVYYWDKFSVKWQSTSAVFLVCTQMHLQISSLTLKPSKIKTATEDWKVKNNIQKKEKKNILAWNYQDISYKCAPILRSRLQNSFTLIYGC